MSNFLVAPLNQMFGRNYKRSRAPSKNWYAVRNGVEFPIERQGKLFVCKIDGRKVDNTRFGDLRLQLEDDFGCTVSWRAPQ